MDIFDLGGDLLNYLRIDAEALVAHQGFATEFQEDSFVLRVHY
jgi:hypothetical protein